MQIKFFKKEKKFNKEKESLWLNINFYWELAVCFVFLSIALSLFFGYYLFMQINTEPAVSSSNTRAQIETVKKDRLSKVLDIFSTRLEKSNGILSSPAPIIDPSL